MMTAARLRAVPMSAVERHVKRMGLWPGAQRCCVPRIRLTRLSLGRHADSPSCRAFFWRRPSHRVILVIAVTKSGKEAPLHRQQSI